MWVIMGWEVFLGDLLKLEVRNWERTFWSVNWEKRGQHSGFFLQLKVESLLCCYVCAGCFMCWNSRLIWVFWVWYGRTEYVLHFNMWLKYVYCEKQDILICLRSFCILDDQMKPLIVKFLWRALDILSIQTANSQKF